MEPMEPVKADNAETGYKCSRCGAMFGAHGGEQVQCPFCAMVCDDASCRVVDMSNEEY